MDRSWRVGHLEKAFASSLEQAGQQCPLPHPGPEENRPDCYAYFQIQ